MLSCDGLYENWYFPNNSSSVNMNISLPMMPFAAAVNQQKKAYINSISFSIYQYSVINKMDFKVLWIQGRGFKIS